MRDLLIVATIIGGLFFRDELHSIRSALHRMWQIGQLVGWLF